MKKKGIGSEEGLGRGHFVEQLRFFIPRRIRRLLRLELETSALA